MNNIQHINSNHPALFEDVTRAFEVVNALGKGALDIAVVSDGPSKSTELKVLEVAELVARNQEKPGEFAEYIVKAKRPSASGREIAVLREGKVKRALIHWAGKSGNLMKGMTRRELAKFFRMAPTDKRLDQIAKGIESALLNSLGVRAGWSQGRFRILTAKQVEAKQRQRQMQIQGIVNAAEKDQRFLEARGAEQVGEANFQVRLLSDVPEVENAFH